MSEIINNTVIYTTIVIWALGAAVAIFYLFRWLNWLAMELYGYAVGWKRIHNAMQVYRHQRNVAAYRNDPVHNENPEPAPKEAP